MKLFKALILALTLIMSNVVWAGTNLSQTQIKNLQQAYSYGNRKPPAKYNGTRVDFGYIMAAIMWQETSAGINCGTSNKVVGPYQNMVTTVKNRMEQDGIKKSHAQVARELKNPNVSAHWAQVEMDSWLKVHNGNINKALASYNAGWATHKGAGYSQNVLKKAIYLKQNNVLKVEK